MKRILLALLLALAFAAPSFAQAPTGPRDIQPEILAMFRAMVADLTDFDPGLCTETGTYQLISTDGVWTCENPAAFVGQALLDDGTVDAPSAAFTSDPTTGIFQVTPGDGDIDFSSDGVLAATLDVDGLNLAGAILPGLGLISAPSFSFGADLDTGFYHHATNDNQFFVTTGGANIVTFLPTEIAFWTDLQVIDGTAAANAIHTGSAVGTGLNFPSGASISLATNSVSRLDITDTGVTATVPFLAPGGSASAPGHSFVNAPTSGLVASTATVLDVYGGGSLRVRYGSGGMTSYLPILAPVGSVGGPSFTFTGDANTGFFHHASTDGTFHLTNNGVLSATFSTTDITVALPILAADGVVGTPAYSFTDNPNTGMYNTDGTIKFASNGVIVGYMNSTNWRSYRQFRLDDSGGPGDISLTWNSDVKTGLWHDVAGGVEASAPLSSNFQAEHNFHAITNYIVSTTWDENQDFWVHFNLHTTGQILASDGLVTAPSYTFASDPNTGLFHDAEDDGKVFFSVNDTNVMQWKPGAITSFATHRFDDGNLGAPGIAFFADSATGIYLPATKTMNLVADGKEMLSVNTCDDLYDVGSPEQISGDPDFLCDSDGATPFKTTTIHGTLVFEDTHYVVGPGRLSVEYGPTPGLGFYFNGNTMMFTANNGSSRFRVGPNDIRAYAPWKNIDGTAALPVYTFASEPDTGMYLVSSGNLGWSIDETHGMTLNAAGLTLAGGLTTGDAKSSFSYTTSGGDSDAYPVTITGIKTGAGDSFASLRIYATNNGSGGISDAMHVEILDGSSGFSTGLRFVYSEPTNTLYAGILVSGGTITNAYEAIDTSIVNALAIGRNNITTTDGVIASTELDLLTGGILLGEISDPTAGVLATWNFLGTGIRFEYDNDTGGAGFPFQVNARFETAGDDGTAFNITVLDEGAGGSATNGLEIGFLASLSNANYGAGVKINMQEATGTLTYGLRVIGVGTISFGAYLQDPDIETAVHIGMNDIETDNTVISAVMLDNFFGNGDVDIEGEFDVGTAEAFTNPDTTPDVAGGSYFTTTGSQTITNFDGTAYSAGKVVYVLTSSNTTTWDCDTSFYCGSLIQPNFFTKTGDVTAWIYDGASWRLISRTKASSLAATVTVAAPTTSTTIPIEFLPGASFFTVSSFECTAWGGSTVDVVVELNECPATLTSCAGTGGTVTMSANNIIYPDTTFSDAVNQGGRYWVLDFSTVTTAPDYITCNIEYAAN